MYGKKPKMAHAKKPQFNAKLKQAAKEGKLDNNPKFKAAVEKAKPKMYHKKPKMEHTNGRKPAPKKQEERERRHPETGKIMKKIGPGGRKPARSDKGEYFPPNKPEMYNKKPFMMKPGSKQVDSPGPFKANEAAMMFKNNMPKDHRPGHPSEREKLREAELDKDYEAIGKGDVKAYGKRLRQDPSKRSNLDLPAIDDKAVTKALKDFPELKPPKTQGDSIMLTKFELKGGIHPSTYNKFRGGPSKAEKRKSVRDEYEAKRAALRKQLTTRKMADYGRPIGRGSASKTKMYGNMPKMYFGKKK
jgi:hypothetical protein